MFLRELGLGTFTVISIPTFCGLMAITHYILQSPLALSCRLESLLARDFALELVCYTIKLAVEIEPRETLSE